MIVVFGCQGCGLQCLFENRQDHEKSVAIPENGRGISLVFDESCAGMAFFRRTERFPTVSDNLDFREATSTTSRAMQLARCFRFGFGSKQLSELILIRRKQRSRRRFRKNATPLVGVVPALVRYKIGHFSPMPTTCEADQVMVVAHCSEFACEKGWICTQISRIVTDSQQAAVATSGERLQPL